MLVNTITYSFVSSPRETERLAPTGRETGQLELVGVWLLLAILGKRVDGAKRGSNAFADQLDSKLRGILLPPEAGWPDRPDATFGMRRILRDQVLVFLALDGERGRIV